MATEKKHGIGTVIGVGIGVALAIGAFVALGQPLLTAVTGTAGTGSPRAPYAGRVPTGTPSAATPMVPPAAVVTDTPSAPAEDESMLFGAPPEGQPTVPPLFAEPALPGLPSIPATDPASTPEPSPVSPQEFSASPSAARMDGRWLVLSVASGDTYVDSSKVVAVVASGTGSLLECLGERSYQVQLTPAEVAAVLDR